MSSPSNKENPRPQTEQKLKPRPLSAGLTASPSAQAEHSNPHVEQPTPPSASKKKALYIVPLLGAAVAVGGAAYMLSGQSPAATEQVAEQAPPAAIIPADAAGEKSTAPGDNETAPQQQQSESAAGPQEETAAETETPVSGATENGHTEAPEMTQEPQEAPEVEPDCEPMEEEITPDLEVATVTRKEFAPETAEANREEYKYETEIRDYTALLSPVLSRAVSPLNARLKEILSPADYVQLLMGELAWNDSLESLKRKLKEIAENPNNDFVFNRPHYYNIAPEDVHYYGSLMYPKSALVYQDDEYVVECTKGISERYSIRWHFWDSRTCRMVRDFAAATCNYGDIMRVKKRPATFFIPYRSFEGNGETWAGSYNVAHWLDIDAAKVHSYFDGSPRDAKDKLARKLVQKQGCPARFFDCKLDELHSMWLPSSSSAIERLGHSSLVMDDKKDNYYSEESHKACPLCDIWNNAQNSRVCESEGDKLVYVDLGRKGRESVLDFSELSLLSRVRKEPTGQNDNSASDDSPFAERIKTLLMPQLRAWLEEENYADELNVKELGNGYAYFWAGGPCNDFYDGICGLVFPDNTVRVFSSSEKTFVFSDFSRSFSWEQCFQGDPSSPIPEVESSGYPWIINHLLTKSPDGESTDLWLWVTGSQNDLLTNQLRLDEKTHRISLVRQWHSSGTDHLTPCYLPEHKWLLLPKDDNTYNIICVNELSSDEALGQLILESSKGYAIVLPNGHYAGSPGCEEFLAIGAGGKTYDMAALAPWRNRPHEVLAALGGSPADVQALEEANHRWLAKLGYQWDEMPKEPQLSQLPVAEVSLPPLFAKESMAHIDVSLCATEAAITRLRVFVDGSEMQLSEPINVQPGEKEELTLDVPLAVGQNWIEIIPYDENGIGGNPAKFRTILEGKAEPTLYVVALGVSDYDDESLRLSYAAKDAGDLAEAFRKYGIGEKKILCLKDKEVKNAQSLKQVSEFLSSATINDHLIFYVAGHGMLDAEMNYYYAPASFNPERMKATGISMKMLTNTMLRCRARKRLLLLDTCHSGSMGEADMEKLAALGQTLPEGVRAIPTTRGMKVKQVLPSMQAKQKKRYIEELFAINTAERGINVVAGTSGAEYALESGEWNNGVFTACLIEALQGNMSADFNGDGTISALELQQFVAEMVEKKTAGAQRPVLSGVENVSDVKLAETLLNVVKQIPDHETAAWERVTELIKDGCLINEARDISSSSDSIAQMALKKHAPLSVIDSLLSVGAAPDEALLWVFNISRTGSLEYVYRSEASADYCRTQGYDPAELLEVFMKHRPKRETLQRVFCGAHDLSVAQTMLNHGLPGDDPELMAHCHDVPLCELLLQHGGDVNKPAHNGCRPIINAADSSGDTFEKLKWLLQQGANPNDTTEQGETPLHFMRYSEESAAARARMVALLLSHGAEVNAVDNHGRTPLHEVIRSFRPSSFDANGPLLALLKAGADVQARDDDGRTPIDNLLSSEKPAFLQFMSQVRGGGSASPSFVGGSALDFLTSVNSYSDSGSNALYKKRLNMLLPMIANGASVNVTTVETKGNTALHYACGLGHVELIRWLVAHGADVNARTDKGATPTQCCSSAAARAALQGGASVSPAQQSYTPSYGGGSSNSGAASFLPSVNAYSDSGSNALYKKRLNMLLPMIANGSPVDVTTVETKGNTALHYACGLGHAELVRWLLQQGANPNAVTNKGATPLQCSGNNAVSNLLRQYGAR